MPPNSTPKLTPVHNTEAQTIWIVFQEMVMVVLGIFQREGDMRNLLGQADLPESRIRTRLAPVLGHFTDICVNRLHARVRPQSIHTPRSDRTLANGAGIEQIVGHFLMKWADAHSVVNKPADMPEELAQIRAAFIEALMLRETSEIAKTRKERQRDVHQKLLLEMDAWCDRAVIIETGMRESERSLPERRGAIRVLINLGQELFSRACKEGS